MTDEKRISKIAKTGARTAGDIINLILKIIGTLLLTAVTTGVIFICIFAIYVKTNLSTNLDIRLEDYTMTMSQSSVIYCINPATGREEELVTLQSAEFRIWIDYRDIPKYMEYAAVAIEDQRFYKHHGVDWFRTSGAFLNMFLSMRDTFGGSTVTQQLIKNLTEEDDVTVQRKLMEIFRALELERNYDKDEIIELYLNYVYFGHGCYGVGAAAQYYFGKDVKELSLAECASIIGITNNPSIYSPYVSREANKKRQETILSEMYKQGYITSEQTYKKALREELNFQRGENNEYEDVVYSWFEEAVIKDVTKDLMEIKGYPERIAKDRLYYGGYKIIATIDTDMQAKVDSIYKNLEEIPETKGTKKQLQSSMIIADPYTGEIKALAGGVGQKVGNMLLNRATMTQRSPGSSMKPLSVYAPAIEYGLITPDTKFDDSEYVTLTGAPEYKPKNYDRSYRGIVRIRDAVRQSLNTISAQVLDLLKPSVSYRFMTETLGFNLDKADEGYAALALGQLTYGATVREMTSAFSMFPNMGERMETYTYSRVYDSHGELVLENKPKPVSAISDTTAYWITDLLTDAVKNGTGYEARLDNMPTAGKTGSTTEKRDRWFAGYTPYYVAVVWTGYDRPEEIVLKNSSGNPAAQLWKKVMSLIHEDLEPKEFKEPATTYLSPVTRIETAVYTVRCVDTSGVVLSERITELTVGREMTEFAAEIEGYKLVGPQFVVTTLSNDSDQNIAVFTYEKTDETEPPDDGNGETAPDDGSADSSGGSGDTDNSHGYVPPEDPDQPVPTTPVSPSPETPPENTPEQPSENTADNGQQGETPDTGSGSLTSWIW